MIEADVAESRDPLRTGWHDMDEAPDSAHHDLAERVVAAMRQHGSPSYPRAFEVWYAHLSDEMPAVTLALNAILAALNISLGVGWIAYLVTGFIGACILIAVGRMIRR